MSCTEEIDILSSKQECINMSRQIIFISENGVCDYKTGTFCICRCDRSKFYSNTEWHRLAFLYFMNREKFKPNTLNIWRKKCAYSMDDVFYEIQGRDNQTKIKYSNKKGFIFDPVEFWIWKSENIPNAWEEYFQKKGSRDKHPDEPLFWWDNSSYLTSFKNHYYFGQDKSFEFDSWSLEENRMQLKRLFLLHMMYIRHLQRICPPLKKNDLMTADASPSQKANQILYRKLQDYEKKLSTLTCELNRRGHHHTMRRKRSCIRCNNCNAQLSRDRMAYFTFLSIDYAIFNKRGNLCYEPHRVYCTKKCLFLNHCNIEIKSL
jgi:hypothetical protein